MGDWGANVELEARDDCDAESREDDCPFIAFGYPGLGSGRGYIRVDRMDGRISTHRHSLQQKHIPNNHTGLAKELPSGPFALSTTRPSA